MPSLGPAEILVILVVALLVFGPNKMPDIARQVGRGLREFRRVQQHLSTELRDVVSEFDGSSESATADVAAHPSPPDVLPGGDPVPTLPPRFDAADYPAPTGEVLEVPEVLEAPVTPGAPAPPSTPAEGGRVDRGQRVWPPPTSGNGA